MIYHKAMSWRLLVPRGIGRVGGWARSNRIVYSLGTVWTSRSTGRVSVCLLTRQKRYDDQASILLAYVTKVPKP